MAYWKGSMDYFQMVVVEMDSNSKETVLETVEMKTRMLVDGLEI